MPSRVLVDTSALYAISSSTDRFHDRATYLYQDLIDRQTELWVSSYILVETFALVHNRLGFEPLLAVQNAIQAAFRTYWVDSSLHNEAWKLILKKKGVGLSFVDCSTVVVAERLESPVLAFDTKLSLEIPNSIS